MASGRPPRWLDDFLSRARRVVIRHLAAIGQTFFVYDAWVGLAAVVVLAVAAPHLAVAGMIASVIARVTAECGGVSSTFLDTGLVELNGWFLGLACATFFAVGPSLAVSLVLGGVLVSGLSIVMYRLLAAWEIPLVIGPYVPAFWLLWSALTTFAWNKVAVLPTVPPAPASPLLVILLGGLRGVGQIFFLPNAAVGVGLAIAASIADRRLGVAMVGASIAAVGMGYLAGTPAWQVETGLAGFTAALIAAAALRRFAGIGVAAVAITIVTIPFLEAAALRLAGAVGVHALSAPYVWLVWTFALLRRSGDPDRSITDRPSGRGADSSGTPGTGPPLSRAGVFEGENGMHGAPWGKSAAADRSGSSSRFA
ncbi:MAG TPA: urea transporter [Methylomirabilota bacterium]|nr:urea transporter [Methylomirabilota bacterium]